MWGSTDVVRVEERSGGGPRGVRFLRRGRSLPHHLAVCGSAVSSPSRVWGKAPATWQFRTHLYAYKAAPGVDFADIKYISLK